MLAEWVFAIYKKDGDNFIFTGPYKVEANGFVAGSNITLTPNTHYHDGKASARPHHLIVKVYAGGDALAAGLKAGEVDVAFHLPVTAMADIKAQAGIHAKTFEVGYHYMAFYNAEATSGGATNTNALADVNVRKALDVAIDRSKLVTALGGGKATRSFFPDYSPFYAKHGNDAGDATEAGRNPPLATAYLLENTGGVLRPLPPH